MKNEMREALEREQLKMKMKLSLENNFEVNDLKLVAGVDLAYWEENGQEMATCNIVVFDYESRERVESVDLKGAITMEYVPGFLAFRELNLILETVKLLKSDVDLFMFDGNGTLHSRQMGIASHASFFLNKPTIGVAKQYFKIDGATHETPSNILGEYTPITGENGVTYGSVLRSRVDVKPIYVSAGNFIDQDTACLITMHLVEPGSRLPVTTRYADIESHSSRIKFKNEK